MKWRHSIPYFAGQSGSRHMDSDVNVVAIIPALGLITGWLRWQVSLGSAVCVADSKRKESANVSSLSPFTNTGSSLVSRAPHRNNANSRSLHFLRGGTGGGPRFTTCDDSSDTLPLMSSYGSSEDASLLGIGMGFGLAGAGALSSGGADGTSGTSCELMLPLGASSCATTLGCG
jgi:hypothetical protein